MCPAGEGAVAHAIEGSPIDNLCPATRWRGRRRAHSPCIARVYICTHTYTERSGARQLAGRALALHRPCPPLGTTETGPVSAKPPPRPCPHLELRPDSWSRRRQAKPGGGRQCALLKRRQLLGCAAAGVRRATLGVSERTRR